MVFKRFFFWVFFLFSCFSFSFEKVLLIAIPTSPPPRPVPVAPAPNVVTPSNVAVVSNPVGFVPSPVASSVPSMPVAVRPGVVPVAMPTAPAPTLPVNQMGPQTINLPEEESGQQGNWLKKREWLKHSQQVYEQIVKIVRETEEFKKNFYDRYVSIDNKLDNFYREGGFQQGKLKDLFDDVNKYLDKKREGDVAIINQEEGRGITSDLEIKINIVNEKFKKLKIDLDQLLFDFKSIEELDFSLSDRLKTVDEQIKISINYMEMARKKLDQIWLMIDDRKARLAYYELKGDLLEKVKNIKNYLLQDLSSNFDNVISTINSQILRIKSSIKFLEDKGLILVDRARKIKKLHLQQLEDLEAGRSVTPEKKPEKKQEKKVKTWSEKIFDFFVDLAASVYKFFVHS